MTDIELFLTLANPDENGISRIISKLEFIDEYSKLNFTNGCQWMRGLKGKYTYITEGRGKSWTIRLTGVDDDTGNRSIRSDIKDIIKKQICVHTGFKGTSQNPIEVDHKDGRYTNKKVLSIETQTLNDFQPLCRQANLKKRSDCNKCKDTNLKFDAKELGYEKSTLDGKIEYNETCNGCYWFDPLFFKKNLKNY